VAFPADPKTRWISEMSRFESLRAAFPIRAGSVDKAWETVGEVAGANDSQAARSAVIGNMAQFYLYLSLPCIPTPAIV